MTISKIEINSQYIDPQIFDEDFDIFDDLDDLSSLESPSSDRSNSPLDTAVNSNNLSQSTLQQSRISSSSASLIVNKARPVPIHPTSIKNSIEDFNFLKRKKDEDISLSQKIKKKKSTLHLLQAEIQEEEKKLHATKDKATKLMKELKLIINTYEYVKASCEEENKKLKSKTSILSVPYCSNCKELNQRTFTRVSPSTPTDNNS